MLTSLAVAVVAPSPLPDPPLLAATRAVLHDLHRTERAHRWCPAVARHPRDNTIQCFGDLSGDLAFMTFAGTQVW